MEHHPLHAKYPKLHTSAPVEHAAERAGAARAQPPEKLEAWMNELEHIHIGRDKKVAERIKKLYYRDFCLQPDAPMPKGFFKLQARIALNEGRVEVEGENHKERIESLTSQFVARDQSDKDFHAQVELTKADYISKQHDSLDKWVDYLSDPETLYPMWFKYYVFRNITKMGGYDKADHSFRKRTSQTTDSFPHLDSEALARVLEVLRDHYGIDNTLESNNPEGEPIELDDRTKQLLDTDASFSKLYAHTLEHLSPISEEALAITEGRWQRYPAGSSGAELSAGVRASTTGWCIADPGTASNYLHRGDFWVYYTPTPEGGEIARIAIATNGNSIGEVRGIVASADGSQHLEGAMTAKAQAKLQELPGGNEFIKPAADMQALTEIYDYLQTVGSMHAPLSDDQLTFLYELNSNIQSLGYGRDPRIDEILKARAGQDSERLKPLFLEGLRQQAETCIIGTNNAIEALNTARPANEQIRLITPEQFRYHFDKKWAEWEANGSLEFIAGRFEKLGEKFTLVATPNVLATADQIIALAKAFGEGQPYTTDVFPEIYHQYPDEILSGYDSSSSAEPIRFLLIPSKFSPELASQTSEQQNNSMQTMREANPNLTLGCQAVLDDLFFWYARHALGDTLSSGNVYETTYVRHFDLEPQQLDGRPQVPYSNVFDGGWPRLDLYDASFDDGGRFSVG